jgi:hypothetical protein
MDETERLRISQLSSSMDPAHKALLYEIMKKNVGLITLISIFLPGRCADIFEPLPKRHIDFAILLACHSMAIRHI